MGEDGAEPADHNKNYDGLPEEDPEEEANRNDGPRRIDEDGTVPNLLPDLPGLMTRNGIYRKLVLSMTSFRSSIIFFSYVLFLFLAVVSSILFVGLADNTIPMFDKRLIHLVGGIVWFLLGCLFEYPSAIFGGAFHFRWGGPFFLLAVLFHLSVNVLLFLNFERTRKAGLELVMFLLGLYLYALRYNTRALRSLRYAMFVFEDNGKATPISFPSMDENALQETFEVAAIALGLPVTHLPAKDLLRGMKVRKGPEWRNDWAAVLIRLSALVCWSPRKKKKKSTLSSSQYRKLVNQMVLDIVESDDDKHLLKRSFPLSSFEVMNKIWSRWAMLPWNFLYVLFAAILSASIYPLQATFFGDIITQVGTGNQKRALSALIGWGTVTLAQVGIAVVMADAQSRLNSGVTAISRDRIMDVVLKGGTEFAEANAPGEIVDAFTSQIGRLEMMLINATFTLLISLVRSIVIEECGDA